MTLHLSQSCQNSPPLSYTCMYTHTHVHTHTLTHTSRGALLNATDQHLLLMLPLTGQGSQTFPLVFLFFYFYFLLGVYPRAWKAQCHSVKEGYIEKDRWRERGGKRGVERAGEIKRKQKMIKWERGEQKKTTHPLHLLPHPKLTSDHPQKHSTFLYFKKRGQIVVVFLCFSSLLPHSIDCSERMANRWTVIPLWDFCLSNLSQKLVISPPPPTHTQRIHTQAPL